MSVSFKDFQGRFQNPINNAEKVELIVKYNGSLEKLESPVIHVEPLINGYAIVTIREDFIDAFSELDEVEYIEKPKRLFFQ